MCDPVEMPILAIEFVPVKEYKDLFPQFSHVHDDYAIPGNCEVTDIPLQSLVGNRIDFKIITKNQNNSCCSKGGSHAHYCTGTTKHAWELMLFL